MYSNNGLTIVQTGADPTPINGGYNVLVAEQNGTSTILAITATGTVAEQIAMPAATVAGAAVLRPDETNISEGDVNVAGSTATSAGGAGGNATSGSRSGAIAGSSSSSSADRTVNRTRTGATNINRGSGTQVTGNGNRVGNTSAVGNGNKVKSR